LFFKPTTTKMLGNLKIFTIALLMRFILKHTILKKYSSTIATIFTAIMSFLLFSHPITVNFGLGVAIVFISMHQAPTH
ncbi:uncharacterized protein HaLaN_16747, partial [Haematococcus lacustris]